MAEGKAGKMIDPWAPCYTLRGFWHLCVEWRKKVVPHSFAYTVRNIVHKCDHVRDLQLPTCIPQDPHKWPYLVSSMRVFGQLVRVPATVVCGRWSRLSRASQLGEG